MTELTHQQRLAKAHVRAQERTVQLQQQTVEALRSRLASVYHVMPYERTTVSPANVGNTTYGVSVKRHQCEGWEFRIWFNLEARGYAEVDVIANGSGYLRNGKNFRPQYAPDKFGRYNFVRMAEDVDRAFESNRTERQLIERRHVALLEAHGNFLQVCKATGLQPAYAGANYATTRIGPFEVSLDAERTGLQLKATLDRRSDDPAKLVRLISALQRAFGDKSDPEEVFNG